MTMVAPEHLSELERDTNFYLGLVKRIDAILKEPILTLIRITAQYAEDVRNEKTNNGARRKSRVKSKQEPETRGRDEEAYFPVWMSEEVQPAPRDHLFTKSLCFATLQRVIRLQRRSPWLDGDAGALLFSDENQKIFVNDFTPKGGEFKDYLDVLTSRTFGALDPLTASQVFGVLLHAGEAEAHKDMGFLAFFAMVWPLYRRFPYRHSFGAAIEPWQPKAYVTARCVLPIKELQDYCTERAALLEAVNANMRELEKRAKEPHDPKGRWLFNAELDDLSANLLRLRKVAIDRDALEKCAKEVQDISDETSQQSNNRKSYALIRRSVARAVRSVGVTGVNILDKAQGTLDDIKTNIIDRLTGGRDDEARLREMGLKFADEYTDGDDELRASYFYDLFLAALASWRFCEATLKKLREASVRCSRVSAGRSSSLRGAIAAMARANREVAADMNLRVSNAAVWCRTVVEREIAHASAKNFTDFDPSELVSAIAVAIRWNQMTTTVQVSDAVSKALDGARADGSWIAGQPFYSPNHALGLWPVTSDIVWTLTGALKEHPRVEDADDALFRFVDWLERTRTVLIPKVKPAGGRDPGAERTKTPGLLRRMDGQPMVGWMSDRLRHHGKIHFATTAFSINALLEIRDLIEYRLWQLCEKRFTVVRTRRGLKDVDPTDLGARHSERLHRHLAKMARDMQNGRASKDDEHSLILHGPPGSSKTFIAKAFSVEMGKATKPWGAKSPRFLQITPADFTRLGEDRLDSEARLIFDLLSGVRGVTVFFDEIDDLLRKRTGGGDNKHPPSFMELVVPAMLNRLADLREACPRQEICFLLATNYVDSIEPALIRKGRIDRAVAVVYPDHESRRALVAQPVRESRSAWEDKKLYGRVCTVVAEKMPRWPYLTIQAACEEIKGELGRAAFASLGGDTLLHMIEDLISPIVHKHGISFSEPNYKERVSKPGSRELRNEYLSHLISSFTGSSLPDFEGQFKGGKITDGVGSEIDDPKLYAELTEVLAKQKRVSPGKQNGSIP